jgi:NAD(P)-dependent dehydrogenase (short-subunit alcohol dehydrogenase family)
MASPLFDLTGKVAVVTGSSKGIGKSIAEQMARHGAKVVISSRKAPACEEVAESIRRAGGQAVAIPANISDKAQLETLVAKTRQHFGPIDILVCNAASNPYYGPTEKMPDDAFDKIMRNNILSNIWLSNLCAPDMKARKDGAIIVVSSIGGLRGTAILGAYGISKAADMALVRNLALELGPHNIRVNTIAPGLVKTDFAKALWEDEALLENRLERSPLKRIGEPDDIAKAVEFLLADAPYVTGQILAVDGGRSVMLG